MPYNITIEFMDGTYDIRGNPKTAFNLGDIAEVYNHMVKPIGSLVSGVKFELFNTPPTTPRKWFMHVLGVPDLINFEDLKQVLMKEDTEVAENPRDPFSPLVNMKRFRRWNIDHAGMNVNDKNKLANDKQVTFTYAKFQNAILDKTGNNNLFTEVVFG